jgi:hypothetical protein
MEKITYVRRIKKILFLKRGPGSWKSLTFFIEHPPS